MHNSGNTALPDRLQQIAIAAYKEWVDLEIIHTTPSPAPQEACDDQVKCLVNVAIDWRRDYVAALTSARDYQSIDDFDRALEVLQKRTAEQTAEMKTYIHDAATAHTSIEFAIAATAMLSSFPTMAQCAFMNKIKVAFAYAHGDYDGPQPYAHQALFEDIMKKQGTFEEWQTLRTARAPHSALPPPPVIIPKAPEVSLRVQ